MTKKDLLIAETIKQSLQVELDIEAEGNDTKIAQISLKTLARHIATKLGRTNSRFNSYIFYNKCGLTSQEWTNDYIPF